MKIEKAKYEILKPLSKSDLDLIEKAGRLCYKSEDKIKPGSAERLIKALVKSGHESVIEHASMSVLFSIDRAISHEIVRHRLCSFSQVSTRYVRYNEDITFIKPCFWEENSILFDYWKSAMGDAEYAYLNLLSAGATPEQARSVLPNSLKTEIVVTANMREWRHIFKLRCSKAAHPQIREVMIPLRDEMIDNFPCLFAGLREVS